MKACFDFNVLVYPEDDCWVAHCLELGIVNTDTDDMTVVSEMIGLISLQLKECFRHDNLEHFYYPAELKYWKAYWKNPRLSYNRISKGYSFMLDHKKITPILTIKVKVVHGGDIDEN